MTLPIDSALLPADVRQGGAQAQKLYSAALEFEKLLTTQLTQSLASAITGDSDGDGEADDTGDDGSDGVTSGGSSAASSQLAQQLPAQLADAIAQSGGLGLAPRLYEALAARQGLTGGGSSGAAAYAGLDGEAQTRVAAAARVAGGSR